MVVWKPFSDGKRPFLVALIQSTVQKSWVVKARDVLSSVWLGWLDTGMMACTGIAIPFVTPPYFPKRDELSRTVHLVFDRLRLAEFLAGVDPSQFDGLEVWNTTELARAAA